jgi:putative transposase
VSWKVSAPMSERLKFVQACIQRRRPIKQLCAEFGISEKTGYKFLDRFGRDGPAGLEDRSHARHHQGRQTEPRIAAQILALRKRHPLYGPVKLRDMLRHRDPDTRWPAASTIGDLLTSEGLVPRRRRRPSLHRRLDAGRTEATAPNVVWTADFKGEFLLGDGSVKCYPLTVLDLYSHFLLGCAALTSTAVLTARQRFEGLFQRYGLPEVIRTDNGVPFAQPHALGRLGTLAVWWIRLGVRPEHIPPARPSANGAHERFHKTLKAHTIHAGAAASLGAQQRRFDRFRAEYNTERPHAALADHVPPATLYSAESREYVAKLSPLEYPAGFTVRRVTGGGSFKHRGTWYFLTRALSGEEIALSETADDLLTVSFGPLLLGDLDLRLNRFTGNVRWGNPLTPRR